MTAKERRENRHRANVNNPKNPQLGQGFHELGTPPQPAQALAGHGRPDRIDEGRGQAPERRRSGEAGKQGTVAVGANGGHAAPASTPIRDEAGGFGGQVRQTGEGA